MKLKNTILTLISFSFLQVVSLSAQNMHQPVRLEAKTVTIKETSSKYGTQMRKVNKLIVTYDDSTFEEVTHRKLGELLVNVPQAQLEWQKYNRNRVYEVSSIPLFGAGLWGAYNLATNKEHKSRNALIAIVGLAGGYTTFEHFDWQKKRNLKKILMACNKTWSHQKGEEKLKDNISPDIIKLGLIHDNAIGIGLAWRVSE